MAEISTAEKIDRSAKAVIDRNKSMRAKAEHLFNTVEGREVYEWLMDQFYHNQYAATDETKLSRHAGRRDVMVLLRQIVETKK